jgi:hypothetical protein
MRLRMGSQHYFSSRSKHNNGNWNEGFLFTISYHNQLFDTIEVCYSQMSRNNYIDTCNSWIYMIKEKNGDQLQSISVKRN